MKHHGQPNKRVEKWNQERAAAEANHKAYSQMLKETMLGKLCLVGISGQGISTSFVTDIQSDMIGAIAVALSTDKGAGENGMYFDIRQLTFYKVFSEVETEKKIAEFATVSKPEPGNIETMTPV